MISIVKRLIVYVYSVKTKLLFNRKISKIYKSIPEKINIPKHKIQMHKKLWSAVNSKSNLNWYKVFASVNGIDDPRYISEYDYYINVEPRLNNMTFCEAYSDKNYYHRFIDSNLLPRVYIRMIDGVLYNQSYQCIEFTDEFGFNIPSEVSKVIIKKSFDTGGGKGVGLAKIVDSKWIDNHGLETTWKYLSKVYGRNFVVQEYIEQHPFFNSFNYDSVNTIRVFTYRSAINNEIIPLHSVLRIGKLGSFVDNQASGGISCGINNDGILNEFAVTKNGKRLLSNNGILFSEVGFVYKYDEIISIAKQIASSYYYHRLLGFDFCVDKNSNVKLIEINTKNNEINFFQMNNGPLFGDYTEEIINFCKGKSKVFCIDFEVY
jgi:hypothetical protein